MFLPLEIRVLIFESKSRAALSKFSDSQIWVCKVSTLFVMKGKLVYRSRLWRFSWLVNSPRNSWFASKILLFVTY